VITSSQIKKCAHGHTLVVKFPINIPEGTHYQVQIQGFTQHSMFQYNTSFAFLPKSQWYLAACTQINIREMHTDTINALRLVHEWIQYHIIQGVQHFTIYCNSDCDLISKNLSVYKNKINFLTWHDFQAPQQVSCIHRYRHRASWVSLTDADEFLQPLVHRKTVRELLYPIHSSDIGGVCAISHLFQKTQPSETRISLYNRLFQTFQPIDSITAYISHISQADQASQPAHPTHWIISSKFVTQSWFLQSPHRFRHKCIVNPENVDTFSVHEITSGKKMIKFDHTNTLRINHYRYQCDFCQGVFQYDASMSKYKSFLHSPF